MDIVSTIKGIMGLVKGYNNAELNKQIRSLEKEIENLDNELGVLKKENKELEEKLKFSKNLVFKKHFYFDGDDPHPYCQACWDSKKSAIRLKEVFRYSLDNYRYDCPICKETFTLGKDERYY